MTGPQINKVHALIRAIDCFRRIDPEFPPQLVNLFLHAALAPDRPMSDLAERADVSLPSVSRHVERLGKVWSPGRAGHDLLEWRENPSNRRQKLVRLTANGERFLADLLKVLD
jgi:DNA-binding MarR family transcriptional regulator